MSSPETYMEQPLEFEDINLDSNDFDINAAFAGAMEDVVNNDELAMDERIRRMESIITEGSSETYREFVDFQAMAGAMEMMCNHNHALGSSMRSSEALSGFMSEFSSPAEQPHDHPHEHNSEEDNPDSTKDKKKKKKKSIWDWRK